MSYVKTEIEAGPVRDVTVCHDPKHNSPKRPRSKKQKRTTEKQKKNNERRSKLRLFRLVSANYKTDDLWLTLTHEKELTPEEAKKHSGKFLRDLRDMYHKHGIPLKYIIITGVGRVHNHLLINNIGISSKKIRKLWREGFMKIQTFGGEYEDCIRLSNYMDKVIKKQHKRNWSCSQNLVHPQPKKTVVPASSWREPIKPPKGYYLEKDSVHRGETGLGYPYLSYRLIKLPEPEEDST